MTEKNKKEMLELLDKIDSGVAGLTGTFQGMLMMANFSQAAKSNISKFYVSHLDEIMKALEKLRNMIKSDV
jgi:CheY-specific phosphatase CheX